ncbi:MAG TPA: DUF1501 domain-containing protein, partial [Planctomycetaceae bacterium]|nr:DUF1501 domain-containing protein [Planctomycetaceae bacterium]
HDSFDMKPDAPDNIRGEFDPISTRTPGLQICEHLPRLADCSDKWAVVRSLSHSTNGHSLGHHIMLTGRSDTPRGFSGNKPQATDHPSIVSQVGYLLRDRSKLPGAAVIPDMITHASGRIIPGQFGGVMGERHDPWIINAAPQCRMFGACPNCFDHQRRPVQHVGSTEFQPPNLALAEGVTQRRLDDRTRLLGIVERQQSHLDQLASVTDLDRYRDSAISLLSSSGVRKAFDLTTEPDPVRSLYGRNLFGSSCLLARRLVECGVGLVQVNMGRNETWDTHGNAFPHLKNNLLPPMDQAVAGLVSDLDDRGLLDSTMIVMAGEFGRTPKVFGLPQHYELPGRDHWGAVQSVFFAGGGVRGGTVIGASDKIGGHPKESKQTPETMAATIYDVLGIPHTGAWYDSEDRPHHVYQDEPIPGLLA